MPTRILLLVVIKSPINTTLVPAPPRRRTRARAQDLPIPAAQPGDRPAEPGVGGRHHLPPDRARVPLPGGGDRLGEPGGAGVAAVEHDGYFVLHRRARGSIGP